MEPVEPRGDCFGPYEPHCLSNLHVWGFKDWIEAVSGGRIEVEILEPNAVFPIEEALTAVGGGAVDVARSPSGYWSGTMPEMDVAGGMPGTPSDPGQQFALFYDYGVNDMCTPLYEPYNVLWFPFPGAEHMNIMGTFEMPDIASLKGHKIRTWGPWGDYIDALGGSPLTLPYGDCYMAMKLGTIEGMWTGAQSLESIKMKEVVSDFIINTNPCSDCLLINKDSFAALPQDLQDLISYDLKYWQLYASTEFFQHQEWIVGHAVEEMGIKLWTWSDEEMVKVKQIAMDEIWSKYAAKSPISAEIVEIIVQQLKDHGRL